MGLTEQAQGAAGRGPGGGVDAAALARVASQLLGGGQGGPLRGLAGLRAAFEGADLGAAFASWVGTGPNRPISADELTRALGAETIGGLARAAGADPARVAAALAEVLPRVVDQLTPGGLVPGSRGEPAAVASRLRGRP